MASNWKASSVADWYNANTALEDSRLDLGRLEKAVTTHYINEAIEVLRGDAGSTKQLKIADVGGGTGVYAIPLAQASHRVTFCDISFEEVELAQQKAVAAGVSFEAGLAFDARDLRRHPQVFKPAHYDITLLLGPLYHILDLKERADVFLAASEMTRPGGFIIAAFVMRNAHLRDVATRDPERLTKDAEFYAQYLADGKYSRGRNAEMHHSTVTEVRELVATVTKIARENGLGLEMTKMASCEGFLGFRNARDLSKLDDATFGRWMDVLLQSAEDEVTLGCADHMLVVLRGRDLSRVRPNVESAY